MPLMPGKFTSSIRQAESARAAELRNSSADAKLTTSKPAAVMTRCNMRAIEGSSSITEICVFIGGMPVPLGHLGVYQHGMKVRIVRGFQRSCTKVQYSKTIRGRNSIIRGRNSNQPYLFHRLGNGNAQTVGHANQVSD